MPAITPLIAEPSASIRRAFTLATLGAARLAGGRDGGACVASPHLPAPAGHRPAARNGKRRHLRGPDGCRKRPMLQWRNAYAAHPHPPQTRRHAARPRRRNHLPSRTPRSAHRRPAHAPGGGRPGARHYAEHKGSPSTDRSIEFITARPSSPPSSRARRPSSSSAPPWARPIPRWPRPARSAATSACTSGRTSSMAPTPSKSADTRDRALFDETEDRIAYPRDIDRWLFEQPRLAAAVRMTTDIDSPRRSQFRPNRCAASKTPSVFEFECTDELVPLTEFIGQDRAHPLAPVRSRRRQARLQHLRHRPHRHRQGHRDLRAHPEGRRPARRPTESTRPTTGATSTTSRTPTARTPFACPRDGPRPA